MSMDIVASVSDLPSNKFCRIQLQLHCNRYSSPLLVHHSLTILCHGPPRGFLKGMPDLQEAENQGTTISPRAAVLYCTYN